VLNLLHSAGEAGVGRPRALSLCIKSMQDNDDNDDDDDGDECGLRIADIVQLVCLALRDNYKIHVTYVGTFEKYVYVLYAYIYVS